MGVDAGAGEKKVAFVKCAGTCDKTQKDYEYTGNEDCASMMFVQTVDQRHVTMDV